jgi:2-polyprenyl-3-methyl-5-hydroxy-6-metoxy-1,4-benzoquinol methylase
MQESFDRAEMHAFAARMLGILNGGAMALMISLGHRAGLFDAMAVLDWATCPEIAKEAGLVERYVREWLGAMTTGGIVEVDASRGAFRLPPAHAACLTRGARPHNLAAAAQWVPLLGSVEDRVLACFEQGGGVPYGAYERFHHVMAELSDQTVVAALHDAILPLVPGGIAALARGIDVLDVGCGSGRALNEMAAAYPQSRFTGYDLSVQAIEMARTESRERGLANALFEVRDAADLRERDAFDLVTAFDTVHDMARPADALAAISRALRPAGFLLMQDVAGTSHVERDVSFAFAPLVYSISCLYCTTVSLSSGGAGLGAMWGEETARRMLAAAGLVPVEVRSLPHDPINRYFVARRGG